MQKRQDAARSSAQGVRVGRMKALVTGSSGMLGSNIVRALGKKHEICGIHRNLPNPELSRQFQADLTDREALNAIAGAIKPDVIIHCAALTNIELCEKDSVNAKAQNVTATENLINAFGKDVKIIYISTDSVFDGKKGHYSEKDTTSPLNVYAGTKLEGEKVVAGFSKRYVIVRTGMVGWNLVHGKSFTEWLFNSLSGGKEFPMFTDIIFSPICATMLAGYLEKLAGSDFSGIINIASSDHVSKYDFGVIFAGIFGLDKSLIRPTSVDKFGFNALRPKNMSLDVSKAGCMLGAMPSVRDTIVTLKLLKTTK